MPGTVRHLDFCRLMEEKFFKYPSFYSSTEETEL